MFLSTVYGVMFWLSLLVASFRTEYSSDLNQEIHKRGIHDSGLLFDFATSLSFVSRVQDTSLFSPFCCAINIHTQMFKGEFGPAYSELGKTKLEGIRSLVSKQDEKFYMANNVYLPSETTSTVTTWEPLFLLEEYKTRDASAVLKKHQNWVLQKTDGKIASSLKRENFACGERIYSSIIYFKDFWAAEFEIEYTKKDKFILRNGNEISRKFMNAEELYIYKHVENAICDFKMVAIPYKDRLNDHFKRYMVYLIPENSTVESKTLWESFYSTCKGDISELLFESKYSRLQLSIPKIEKLQSKLNLCDITSELFQENKALNVSSKMKTFLQVDEAGTTAIAQMDTDCCDGRLPPSIVVKANVPYIAFIYDVSINRILFILKDEGLKLN